MNNTTQILIGTTLALTAACGYMVYRVDVVSERAAASARTIAELQTRIATLDNQREALEREITRLRASLPPLGVTPIPAQPAQAATREAVKSSPPRAADQPPPMTAPLVVNRHLNDWAKTPDGKEMLRTQRRMGVQRMYAEFFREMNFTPEQAEKFVEVMTNLESEGVPMVGPVMASDGVPLSPNLQEFQARVQRELTELLGPDGYRQFESYRNSFAERLEVNQVAQHLEGMRTPLRDDQRKELLTAMIEERKRVPRPAYTPGMSPEESIELGVQWKMDYDQRVRDRMASVLDPDQLKRLTEYQEMHTNMQRMSVQSIRRAGLARLLSTNEPSAENRIVAAEGQFVGTIMAAPVPPPPPPETQ
ncbi:MAG TPA: hypothetical protein VIL32_13620 [Steroidobacteraceae bacterium]